MVPTDFVLLNVLPLGPSGKVDRRALPAPERGRSEDQPFVPPRDEAEEAMAAIWRDVLAVDRVGVHDNFFELGGHSLLATQVMSRILETFDLEIPLRRLFATPTVAGLAEAVRDAGTAVLDADEEALLRRVEEMSEEGVAEALTRLMAEEVENP